MHGVVSARTALEARRGVFDAPYQGPVYIVDAITNNSGAAGGVLTTRQGDLIGMLGKELRNNRTQTWLNYVVPTTEFRQAVQEITTGRFAPRKTEDEEPAVTTARYQPRDFGLVLLPDIVARTPAFIDRVLSGSAAEQAGLLPDDLIVFIGDQLVTSNRLLREEIGRLEAGDTLKLIVRRDDRLVTVELPVPRMADME
jgi:serine protease Do